jgi:hypothetical protein
MFGDGERRGACRFFFGGEAIGKEIAWKRRRRWEDNIKMDLHEVRCWGMDWIDLAQDSDGFRALVNGVP